MQHALLSTENDEAGYIQSIGPSQALYTQICEYFEHSEADECVKPLLNILYGNWCKLKELNSDAIDENCD